MSIDGGEQYCVVLPHLLCGVHSNNLRLFHPDINE